MYSEKRRFFSQIIDPELTSLKDFSSKVLMSEPCIDFSEILLAISGHKIAAMAPKITFAHTERIEKVLSLFILEEAYCLMLHCQA